MLATKNSLNSQLHVLALIKDIFSGPLLKSEELYGNFSDSNSRLCNFLILEFSQISSWIH